MGSMEGKVIAITGASSGIGRATAHLLASCDALLSLADWNDTGLAETLSSLPAIESGKPPHLTQKVDVSSSTNVDAWITATIAHFGRLDGAANIAGIHLNDPVPLRDASDESLDRLLGVNTKGTFYCMRAQLRVMVSGGSIVNTASIAAHTGLPGMGTYCASKCAVLGLTRTAAKEEGERGIRVNAVAPGSVATPMTAALTEEEREGTVAMQSLKRQAKPEELAKVFAILLSDESSFVTGSCYDVNGGWHC